MPTDNDRIYVTVTYPSISAMTFAKAPRVYTQNEHDLECHFVARNLSDKTIKYIYRRKVK